MQDHLRGLLAWIPADNAPNVNTTVARFVDGQWTKLNPSDWPGTIIHLVPMLDGSVLQIRRGDDPQTVQLTIQPLDSPAIDENQIDALVQQLDDPDPDKRTDAFERLTQFGPGIFPILEKLEPNVPPEIQPRVDQLLEGRLRTKLGGMEIIDDLLTVFTRLPDGGAVFNAPHGVIIQTERGTSQLINPAYLVLRPGSIVQLLPSGLTRQLTADMQLTACHDEWIAARPQIGPMRFLPPDQLTPLLRPSELNFTKLVGIDSRGRWVFRPADAEQPSLILDPTLPDPTPRLAIWLIDTGKEVGWNAAGWPVVRRGADRWMLSDKDWELLSPGDTMFTNPPPPDPILFTDAIGNQYSDGRSTLTIRRPSGRQDMESPRRSNRIGRLPPLAHPHRRGSLPPFQRRRPHRPPQPRRQRLIHHRGKLRPWLNLSPLHPPRMARPRQPRRCVVWRQPISHHLPQWPRRSPNRRSNPPPRPKENRPAVDPLNGPRAPSHRTGAAMTLWNKKTP